MSDELTDLQQREAIMRRIEESSRRRIALLEQEKIALQEAGAFSQQAQELLNVNLNLQRAAVQVMQQKLQHDAQIAAEQRRAATKMAETLAGQKSVTAEQRKELQVLKEKARESEKELQKKIKTLHISQQQQQAQANLASAQQNFFKTTLGVSDAWKTTLVGSMFQSKDALRQMMTNASGLLNFSNLIGSTWMKIVEMTITAAKEYDTMSAKIRQISHGATGLNSLERQTMRAHISMREFGVSIEDAGQSTDALVRTMASFSLSSAQTTTALMRQTNLLQEVGVAAQTSGQAFNFMDKGLNMTTQQSIRLSNRLFGLSKSLKQPPDVIFKDWEQATNELAKYGDRMFEVFAGLSAQAKNTGLAMSQLMGIAAQFDTFDQAGAAVGRLNAILGGPYLSAIEMVYMTEAQRIKALRESISVSGRVFNQLSRHEQQAIAAAAGIRDMATASQLFGGSSQAFAQAAASQEALEKKARESQTAINKLQMAAYGLAVNLAPVVDGIGKFLNILTGIAGHPVGKWLGGFILLIGTFTKVINTAQGAVNALKAAQASLAAAQRFLTGQTVITTGAYRGYTISSRAAAFADTTNVTGKYVLIGAQNAQAASLQRLIGLQRMSRSAMLGVATAGIVGFMAAKKVTEGNSRMVNSFIALAGAAILVSMAKAGIFATPIGAAIGIGTLGATLGAAASAVKAKRQEGSPRGGEPVPTMALVGEEGPEVVQLNRGDNVLNNTKSKQLLAGGSPGGAQGNAELVAAMNNLSLQLSTLAGGEIGGTATAAAGTKVTLVLDRSVLAESVVDILNNDSDLAIA